MPSHARCTQRKGGSGGNREHDYINQDIHPQKEHIRSKRLCKERENTAFKEKEGKKWHYKTTIINYN